MAAALTTDKTISSFKLSTYLDVFPSPALIIKLSDSKDSTKPHPSVEYANSAFYNLFDPPLSLPELELHNIPIEKILLPKHDSSLCDFLNHIRLGHHNAAPLKTRLARNIQKVADDANGNAGLARGGLELDWTAVSLDRSHVVLTCTAMQNISDHERQSAPPTVTKDMSLVTNTVKKSSQSSDSNDMWKTIPRFADSLAGGGTMGEMLRNFDWANNVLGPIALWPQSLLTAVSLTMASSLPMAVWWGPQFILIYNDAYKPIAANKHPWLFGMSGSEGWSEIWDGLEPLARRVLKGESIYSEDHLLFMLRNGFVEETYFTWSYIPLRQEDGSVGGLLNPTFEATGRVIAERRLKTLRDYSALAGTAKCVKQVCSIAAAVMTNNHQDIAFAALYTCTVDHSGSTKAKTKFRASEPSLSTIDKDKSDDSSKLYRLSLMEVVGITSSHPAAPREVVVNVESPPPPDEIWPFHQVCTERKIAIIKGQKMVEGIEGRGWSEAARLVVVCPIVLNEEEDVLAVLVMGTSARRPYDDDYSTFVELLCRQTATSIATVRAYEEEVQRAEALAMIDKAKTAFFSSVSHELRTPLTLILGPCEDMLASPQTLTKSQLTNLSLISRNAARLLKLVNSLLDFSRIEAGRMQATFKQTDIGKLTADLASVFRSAIEKGGVEYLVECESEEGRMVWIDQDMWEKIVFNMIGNAFKFTLKGRISVSVKPSSDKSGVVFAVEDTGTGIPSHEIGRLFERFHRVDGQKGRSHEGTGIGLALTRELVKIHGGSVDIVSEYGTGSTFSVYIPYGTSHLPQDRLSDTVGEDVNDVIVENKRSYGAAVVEEAKLWLTPSEEDFAEQSSTAGSTDSSVPSNSVPASTRGSKILLADDNADMRRYVKTLLSKWWVVTEVSDGQQAIDAISREVPDIIVSDVMMPVLDGFGLLKVVRSLPETKMLPVILLSARAGEEARVDGLQMGADDYLVKPFSAKELVARVHTHLELGKLRVELERRVQERTRELAESELRYKVLASLSPVGIFRTDNTGQITYTNEKWWEITMHDRDSDPEGKYFMTSIHPDDLPRCQQAWSDLAQYGTKCKIEFRWYNHKTGKERWCLGETIKELDERGECVGHVGTITDLTERKSLERERLRVLEVKEREQRRRAEEAEEVKRQQELFIDMTCHELRNPLNGIYHNADMLHESLERMQKEVDGLQKTVETASSSSSPQLSTTSSEQSSSSRQEPSQPAPPASQLSSSSSRPSPKLIASVQKVTNWLSTEVSTDLEAVETISLCAQHQKKIADDVLHMSKISMNLLVLATVEFRPLQEVWKVVRMFETEVRFKGIELGVEVGDSFKEIETTYGRKGKGDTVELWVKGDPTRLAQVMINFLSNAIRFTERGEVRKVGIKVDGSIVPSSLPPSLLASGSGADGVSDGGSEGSVETVKLSREPQTQDHPSPSESNTSNGSQHQQPSSSPSGTYIHYQISISDSGVGMTPEEQATLFRRFGQVSPKTYAEFGGSGLGLFISKRLVELQGGGIAVESEKGRGTTFRFFLKYEVCGPDVGEEEQERKDEASVPTPAPTIIPPPEPSIHSSTQLSPSPSPTSPTPSTTESTHVLIVEDNKINQKVLRRQLETLGYLTKVANHGAEALDLLQQSIQTQTHFDIILMDIEMPIMDGLEAARRIRKLECENGGYLYHPNNNTSTTTIRGRTHTTSTTITTRKSDSDKGDDGRIPIIAVSGNARHEHLQKAFEAGMDDFLVKPYVKKDLVERIEGFVRRRRSGE